MRGRILTLLVFGVLSLSGCSMPNGSVGSAFDALAAPHWEPGYHWTYDVALSSQQSDFQEGGLNPESDSEHTEATFRVINTTATVLGEPVYVVRLDRNFDHPLFSGDLEAFTQKDLELAAVGYGSHVAKSYPNDERNPCGPMAPLNPVPAEGRFPLLRFPLDDGAKWTGSWGPDESPYLQYIMKSHGMVDVETPAGTFRSVYITTDLQPVKLGGPEMESMGSFDFKVRSEVWYSPDVRFIVKNVLSATAQGTSREAGGFQYSFRSVMELAEYGLEVGPAEPAPGVATMLPSPVPVQVRNYGIVTDTEFPLNIANGTAAANFSLSESRGDMDMMYAVPPGVTRVDEFSPLDYDHDRYELQWRIESWKGDEYDAIDGVGDVWTHNFTEGGRYDVRATLRPLKCGDYELGIAYGNVATFWSKEFRIAPGTNIQRTLSVGTFPVSEGATLGKATWTHTGSSNGIPGTNAGRPTFRGPDGRQQSASISTSYSEFSTYPPGDWTLSWDTGGATLNDQVLLTLTVAYSSYENYADH